MKGRTTSASFARPLVPFKAARQNGVDLMRGPWGALRYAGHNLSATEGWLCPWLCVPQHILHTHLKEEFSMALQEEILEQSAQIKTDSPTRCREQRNLRTVPEVHSVVRNLLRSAIHEEASVKTKEQDELGTSQTSIRHHPRSGAP